MKQPFLKAAKLTLALTAAIAIAACNQPKTTTTAATAPAGVKPQIVYVNSDTLLNKYDYFKDMSKRLEEKGKAAQSDLQDKGQAFQREVADYQKGANTMSADQRAATEQRLGRKQQELQAYKENAGAQLQNDQAGENSKLYDRISTFMKAYAKDNGYKMVLTFSKANPTVLYGDPTWDVTADVVKKLNDQYSKEKK